MASHRLLGNRPFSALLVTQFLGAANDNVLKQFITFQAVSGIWHEVSGGAGSPGLIFLIFTLPFLVFSSFGGQFADRHSKGAICRLLKLAEVGVMSLALVFIGCGCYWASIGCLVLMATQSAFFGPAKYGIIPELVPHGSLSRANGMINMTTNLAVIGGMLIGAWLSEMYADAAYLPGVALVALALAGVLSSRGIARTEPRSPGLRIRWNVAQPMIASLREMARDGVLMRVAAAWAFFYFLGVVVMSAVPELGEAIFGPDAAAERQTETGLLLVAIMVGIGTSCLIAGGVSGDRIRLGLVTPAIFAVAVIMMAVPLLPMEYGWILGAFLGLGLCTGFYIIPLQSLLQSRAGDEQRGRVLGTANFLSFLFMAVGGALYFVLGQSGLAPATIVGLNGVACLALGFIFAHWRRRGRLKLEG